LSPVGLAGLDEAEKYEFAIALRRDAPQPHQMRKRDRDRAVALARERGEVRTRDLSDIGVPRCYLTRMCDEGLLIKVGYGRYRVAKPEAA